MPSSHPPSRSVDSAESGRRLNHRFWTIALTALFVSAAPLLLLIPNTDWFFTPEGFLDPWNYVGLFHRYLDPDYLPDDYKLARLPWILSGLVATKMLPPIAAAVALHGVYLCATSLALFSGAYALFGRPALAGVLALLLGFYTFAHGSGGWDYHNTGAGAFYLATFALLALPATRGGNRALLVAAGATAAAAVHSNIMFVNFLPALAFVHIGTIDGRGAERLAGRSVLARGAWVASGAVLLTVILGLVNWNNGRELLFFSPLLKQVMRFVMDPGNQEPLRHPWSSGWVLRAGYLAFPAAVFLAGVAALAIERRTAAGSSRRVATVLALQFVVMALVWIAWELAGQTALEWDYFAYVLVPSCFIALGGVLSRGWPDWCERHLWLTLLSTTLALATFLTVTGIPGVNAFSRFIAPVVFVAGSALLFIALFTQVWRPSPASVLLFIVTFAFANRALSYSADYLASDPCKVQPEVYNAIVDSATWLMKVDPFYTRLYTWFDDEELLHPQEGCNVRLGYMGISMTTMASVGYVAKPFPLPSVKAVPDASVLSLIENGRILAIITSHSAHVEEWKGRVEGLGLTHDEIDRHRVQVLGSEFTIYAWTLHRRPS